MKHGGPPKKTKEDKTRDEIRMTIDWMLGTGGRVDPGDFEARRRARDKVRYGDKYDEEDI